ncbi:MAG: sigma-70 family RNA polymerase sigma factor [Paludibacter sp.]|nr:sigma-70 family RNA polymerase sigma factor [Paludibacter sp.]
MDEQQLIAGCKEGKSWAQKELYDLYSPAMMSICMRYANNRENARDILQDGFIKLFTKIDTYSETGSFAGWIKKIFINTALEFLRQNDILKQSENIEEYDNTIENNDITVLEKISNDDLMTCIRELSDGYRTIFNLYVIEGYTHAEISKTLNISEETSRSQFMRARRILQKKVLLLTGH